MKYILLSAALLLSSPVLSQIELVEGNHYHFADRCYHAGYAVAITEDSIMVALAGVRLDEVMKFKFFVQQETQYPGYPAGQQWFVYSNDGKGMGYYFVRTDDGRILIISRTNGGTVLEFEVISNSIRK